MSKPKHSDQVLPMLDAQQELEVAVEEDSLLLLQQREDLLQTSLDTALTILTDANVQLGRLAIEVHKIKLAVNDLSPS